ncbi:MAG: fluoride efflux transporter CrcB [Candidatus Kapabacteria bacterium]|nr:fluoride efflux transporter CrcB [Candidatus Kapabacteria bacterium]
MSLVLVMLGGAVGSGLRFLVAQWLPSAPGTMPLATILVNVIGSGLLGAVTVLSTQHTMLSRDMALLLGAGLCGGFTTFSTLSVELLTMADHGRLGLSIVYLILSVGLGLAAAAAGAGLARMFAPAT